MIENKYAGIACKYCGSNEGYSGPIHRHNNWEGTDWLEWKCKRCDGTYGQETATNKEQRERREALEAARKEQAKENWFFNWASFK